MQLEWTSASLLDVRVSSFHSDILGEDFDVSVATTATGESKRAPALYVLDSNLFFPAVSQFAGAGLFGWLEPVYVVGLPPGQRTGTAAAPIDGARRDP